MKTILTAIAIVAGAAAANADTFSMDGEGTGTSETTVTQIAEGHIVMVTTSMYEGFSFSENPMSTATGRCDGTMEMMAGKMSGNGHCVYTDADGDTWVVNWVPNGMSDTGAIEGNYSVTGGSGKYMGVSGGGTFSSLTNRETGAFVNTTTGEVTLK